MVKKNAKFLTLCLASFLTLIMSSSFVDETESGGGGSTYKCQPPVTNTCYNVYKGGVLIATEKGVLKF